MPRRFRVALVAAALALALPMQSLAQEVPPEAEGAVATVEAMLEQLQAVAQQIADASGDDPVTILDTILGQEVEVDPGNGNDPVLISMENLVNTIAGTTVIDRENNGGIFGTPEIAAGNIMHVALDIQLDIWSGAVSAGPPEPQMGYEVRESGWSPDTPLVPVLNPLFLAPIVGSLVPDLGVDEADELLDQLLEASDLGDLIDLPPGASLPLLFTHMGGRLKHVTFEIQGEPFVITNPLTGAVIFEGSPVAGHSAGAGILGNNLDTAPRETGEGDPWPIWLPLVTGTGFNVLPNTLLPDTQMDFVGFAEVISLSECFMVLNTSLLRARVCAGGGVLLGDGVAEFDGALDFGELLAPLWENPPAEVAAVVDVLDDVIAELPIGDALDLLGLLGEAPEVPI